MTESDWLTSESPVPLLLHLRGEVTERERSERRASLHSGAGVLYPGASPFLSNRRFGLWVSACVARLQGHPLDALTRAYLETLQRFFEGAVPFDAVQASHANLQTRPTQNPQRERGTAEYLIPSPSFDAYAAGGFCWRLENVIGWAVARDSIARTCRGASEDDWFEWGFSGGPPDPLYQATCEAERRHQADLLREVAGNPFRRAPVPRDWPAWVVSLAESAHDERHHSSGHLHAERLAILSDAMEDAECTDAELLTHLRSPGPHVRGCWALDRVLGRS